MHDDILTHPENYYEIQEEELVEVHYKLQGVKTILYLLSEWILESSNCSIDFDNKRKLDHTVHLLMDLVDRASVVLPTP